MSLFEKIENMKDGIDFKRLRNLKVNLNKYEIFIKEIMKNDNCTEEEAIKKFDEYISKILSCTKVIKIYDKEEVTPVRISKSDIFLIETIKRIQKDGIQFTDILAEIDPKKIEEKDLLRYTGNFEKDKKLLVNDFSNGLEENKQYELFTKNVKSIKEFNMRFDFVTGEYLKYVEANVNKDYNEILNRIIEFLEKSGMLKYNTNIHNERMEKLNIPFMKYDYTKESEKLKIECVKDLLSKETIDRKLNLSTKEAIFVFYANRLAKEIIDMNELAFACRKAKGIDNLKEMPEDEFKELIARCDFLRGKIRNSVNKQKKKSDDYRESHMRETFDNEFERKEFFSIMRNFFSDERYDEYFGKGELDKDLQIVLKHIQNIDKLYTYKDWAVEELIFTALKDKSDLKIANWGYIPEYDKNNKNSIESKKRNVLVAFDLPKFNMPIRIHVERERLERFIKEVTGDTIIPVYKGDKDFETLIKGKRTFLSTQIFMPLTKKQRKEIKEAGENITNKNVNNNYIEHLYWLTYPNRIPKRLIGDKIVNLENGMIGNLKNDKIDGSLKNQFDDNDER